jgi:DNA polymerase I-like protein with 3'-5' exonuclease and polymerase domains
MPFIAQLTKMLTWEASHAGYITLLDGARCRFDFWEPHTHYKTTQAPALSLALAKKRWPGQPLRRYGAHKAFNRKIQGGSARQIKLIMRECYNQGLYPLLQVHDELDFSIGDVDKIKDIMCNTVKLRVPTRADVAIGESWGAAHE